MKDTYALEQQIIREFKKNYQEWDLYAEKVRQNLKNVQDLGKIELIKTKVFIAAETSGRNAAKFLPKKLKDCYSKNREQCQLWIVEGESAAGSLVKARDPAIHAILPLKGRPMTTVYKDIEEVLENDEMRDLISCIGVGVKDYYNLDKVRYGKIVIATDADVDGFAIASSVLATIIDHMKFLIDKGFVYVSVAPLYYQNGKYFYTNADFDKLDKNKSFTRFKGLGELSPNQLYDSMLNPKNQILIQVTSERVEETLALLTRTGARRDLMISNGVVSEEFLKFEKIKEKLI
jgi:DNA gyrase subunit B